LKTSLSHIATIHTGVFAKPVSKGDVVYLQARHFDEFGALTSALHPDLQASKTTEKHLLRPGDVLFAAKGAKNFAAVYESQNPAAVASTTFFVIRLLDHTILPAYLAWVLNNPTSQKILKGNAIGSAMVSISKTVLEKLEIALPSIQQQQCILEIARLSKKENSIVLKLAELRQQHIQQQLINAIDKSNG